MAEYDAGIREMQDMIFQIEVDVAMREMGSASSDSDKKYLNYLYIKLNILRDCVNEMLEARHTMEIGDMLQLQSRLLAKIHNITPDVANMDARQRDMVSVNMDEVATIATDRDVHYLPEPPVTHPSIPGSTQTTIHNNAERSTSTT